jgi:hypothetical protein
VEAAIVTAAPNSDIAVGAISDVHLGAGATGYAMSRACDARKLTAWIEYIRRRLRGELRVRPDGPLLVSDAMITTNENAGFANANIELPK